MDKLAPTPRQQQMLDFIKKIRKERGVSPSLRELQALMGMQSVHGVTQMLEALQRKKLIIKPRAAPRSIKLSEKAQAAQ